MITKIYDVAHGFTAFVRDERSGDSLLFDCGYNEENGFHPADEILNTYGPVGRYFALNLDEDHLDGLPHFRRRDGSWPIRFFHHNDSLGIAELQAMKVRPYGEGLKAVMTIMSDFTVLEENAIGPPAILSPECQFSVYYNRYPWFDDTNNLSMVVFIHGPKYSVVFPGDLEKPGWSRLLAQPGFQADLRRVNIFVAAHHGRESGYCADVFDYCHPNIVVISDEPIVYETQTNCYAQHASGVVFQTRTGFETRRVLTTRCDGDIKISSPPGYRFFINTEK